MNIEVKPVHPIFILIDDWDSLKYFYLLARSHFWNNYRMTLVQLVNIIRQRVMTVTNWLTFECCLYVVFLCPA